MKAGDLVGGKYRLVRRLGQGAMGVVWEAVHEMTSRRVALKLIVNATDNLRKRLLREARAAGLISHRNVVEVYDVGETAEEDPFLVMQLLAGDTLYAIVKRKGRMDLARALGIARDVGRALVAAHAQGIIHRDLKPANVFLHTEDGSPDEVVKVLDFGLCKPMGVDDMLTIPGGLLGSPAYMSPEQIAGAPDLDPRTDIWAFGVLMFELFGGKRPFQGRGPDLIHAVLKAPIPRLASVVPGIDPALDELVAGCIVRDRAARLGSAAEIVARLEVLAEQAARAPQPAQNEDDDEGGLAVTQLYRPSHSQPSHKVAKTIPLMAYPGLGGAQAPPAPMQESPPSYPRPAASSQSDPSLRGSGGWPAPQSGHQGGLAATVSMGGSPAPSPMMQPPQPTWQVTTGPQSMVTPPMQPQPPERRWVGLVILGLGILALIGVVAFIAMSRPSAKPNSPPAGSAVPAAG